MPKNVLTLLVHVKLLQEKSFVPLIALLLNLPKGGNVSADIPDVGMEVDGTNDQRGEFPESIQNPCESELASMVTLVVFLGIHWEILIRRRRP